MDGHRLPGKRIRFRGQSLYLSLAIIDGVAGFDPRGPPATGVGGVLGAVALVLWPGAPSGA